MKAAWRGGTRGRTSAAQANPLPEPLGTFPVSASPGGWDTIIGDMIIGDTIIVGTIAY